MGFMPAATDLQPAKKKRISNLSTARRKIDKLTFTKEGAGKHSGSGSSITSYIVGHRGDLLNELSTEIHEAVTEIDSFGDGHTILSKEISDEDEKKKQRKIADLGNVRAAV